MAEHTFNTNMTIHYSNLHQGGLTRAWRGSKLTANQLSRLIMVFNRKGTPWGPWLIRELRSYLVYLRPLQQPRLQKAISSLRKLFWPGMSPERLGQSMMVRLCQARRLSGSEKVREYLGGLCIRHEGGIFWDSDDERRRRVHRGRRRRRRWTDRRCRGSNHTHLG